LMLHLKFKVTYFSDFTRTLILSICEKLEYEFFPPGSHLMKQGEIGDRMFIVFQGKAEISINKLTNLKP
jgi:CRP-like cAMP-binding protein